MEWRVVPQEELDEYERTRCRAKRGPRSTVVCELRIEHDDRWHFGRSQSGRWFPCMAS